MRAWIALAILATAVSTFSSATQNINIPQGSTGTSGKTGASGASGSSGATGASGAGSTGQTGASGSAGAVGATGQTGASGSNGTQGASGQTGASGSNGGDGSTGATGQTGGTGPSCFGGTCSGNTTFAGIESFTYPITASSGLTVSAGSLSISAGVAVTGLMTLNNGSSVIGVPTGVSGSLIANTDTGSGATIKLKFNTSSITAGNDVTVNTFNAGGVGQSMTMIISNGDTFLNAAYAQGVTNKLFTMGGASTNVLRDSADTSKKLVIAVSGATTATTTVVLSPAASGTFSNVQIGSKTAAYTLSSQDDFIAASSGPYSINLPTAVAATGKRYFLKQTDALGAITIAPSGTQTIETGLKLQHKYDSAAIAADGANWQVTATRIAPTFTQLTSGSGTYTAPSGVLYLRVRMVGGGGGGATSGTAVGTVATAGGDTTFGTSLLTAKGGGGGIFGDNGGAGGGFTIASPAVQIQGISGPTGTGYGGGVMNVNVNLFWFGAPGASSMLGQGGFGGAAGRAGGAALVNSGGGGGGGGMNGGVTGTVDSGSSGGAGGFVDALLYAPSATYSYAVGAKGNGGTAGANGAAGGDGGSGLIIVEEHFQ